MPPDLSPLSSPYFSNPCVVFLHTTTPLSLRCMLNSTQDGFTVYDNIMFVRDCFCCFLQARCLFRDTCNKTTLAFLTCNKSISCKKEA